eukprot:10272323-Karenia_brevis.AAC.1
MRWYARGSQCTACLTEFWTHERLICHLEEKSSRCHTVVCSSLPRMTDEEYEAEDNAAKKQVRSVTASGRRRAAAEPRATRASGPFTAYAVMAGIDHHTLL